MGFRMMVTSDGKDRDGRGRESYTELDVCCGKGFFVLDGEFMDACCISNKN